MKVLCSHLLNGIMDQDRRSVCVDLLCSLEESFSYKLPLTYVFASVDGVGFCHVYFWILHSCEGICGVCCVCARGAEE